MATLDKLYNQMNTQKKVQRPSDDPIVTGRALKLKINVLEAQQHQSNVKEAIAWMGTTENALMNVNEILKDIRTRVNNGANGTLEAEDRNKLLDDIAQLTKQLQQEANVTYAGRYVFSGYKTNEPVFLTKDTDLANDVTLAKDLVVGGPFELTEDITYAEGFVLTGDMQLIDPMVAAGDITIGSKTTLTANLTVGAAGMVAPHQVTDQGGTVYAAGDAIPAGTVFAVGTTFESGTTFPAGTTFDTGSTLPKYTKMPAGTMIPENTIVPGGTRIPAGITLPAGTTIPTGTLNLQVLNNTNGHLIEYEIGVNTTVEINTLGMPEYMEALLKDIDELFAAAADPTLTEEDAAKVFTNMLGNLDDHIAKGSVMLSDLGSREKRLDYTAARLVSDVANFKELLANTEGVQIEEVYVDFQTQMAVYQSALNATSQVVLPNLAQFLK